MARDCDLFVGRSPGIQNHEGMLSTALSDQTFDLISGQRGAVDPS